MERGGLVLSLLSRDVISDVSHVEGGGSGKSWGKLGSVRGEGVSGSHGVNFHPERASGSDISELGSLGSPEGWQPRSTHPVSVCAVRIRAPRGSASSLPDAARWFVTHKLGTCDGGSLCSDWGSPGDLVMVLCGDWLRRRVPDDSWEPSGSDSARNRQDLDVFQLWSTPQAPVRARGREIRFSALDPSGARLRGDGGWAPVPKFWVITPVGDLSVYRSLDPALGWLRGPGTEVQRGTWPLGRIPGGSRESSGFDFTRNRPDLDICQLRPPPRALKGVRGRGSDLDVCQLRPTPQALVRARGVRLC